MQNKDRKFALGVDIGGTKIDVGLVDTDGNLIGEIDTHFVPFDEDGSAIPEGLLDIIEPYIEKARETPGTLRGLGMSVCGNIDMDTGEAVLIPNLHWRNVPFGPMAAERFDLPICLATDVRMAVLGEATWGIGQGVRDFAWVTIGTGLGAYLWLNGKPYGGKHSFAGNFGHNTIDEINGYLCGCGKRGCLETLVAGPAIARQGQAAVDEGRSPKLGQLAGDDLVTTEMVLRAEAARDPAAMEIIDGVVRWVAIGLSWLVNILDIDLIVMGGGVTKAGPEFLERINGRIREYLMTEEARQDLRIVPESLPNAAIFGAAAYVFQGSGDI